MRRSTVLSLPLEVAFAGPTLFGRTSLRSYLSPPPPLQFSKGYQIFDEIMTRLRKSSLFKFKINSARPGHCVTCYNVIIVAMSEVFKMARYGKVVYLELS